VTKQVQRPFSIRVFLPDGTPEGLRIIEKSNWTGLGLVIPRQLLPAVRNRPELDAPGIYVLVGPPEEGDLPRISIGEGDPVRARLEQHYAKKEFWTWAMAFVAKDAGLNKAHIQHLEARLVELARRYRRAIIDNQTQPQHPALSEADSADAESFLEDMLSIFPLAGLSAFQRPPEHRKHTPLLLESKGIAATGYDSPQGFVVRAGAGVVRKEVPSIIGHLKELRAELVKQGVIAEEGEDLVLAQDYVFSSPSTAAGVLLAKSTNGRTAWKDKDGRTLRQIQEMAGPGASK
jgi:hypothetical protein